MTFPSTERLRDAARSAFWLVPSLCVVVAIGLAIGLVLVDQQLGQTDTAFLFPGPPEGARALLSSIVQAMIAFTGLVFSITIVVLQLTSSQFSPRVLRSFVRDRTIQLALGIFVATFVYAMIVLREVRGTQTSGSFVPRIAVSVTFLLVLVSVGLFIRYISHMANMIRLASIVDSIGRDADALLQRRYPSDAEPPRAPTTTEAPVRRTVPSPCAGVLVSINEPAIVDRAAAADALVTLVPRVGDYVPAGGPLARLHGDGEMADEQLTGNLAFDIERTLEQDVAFAFRQLVDIAQRALSPGINDPTTATQAIDIIHNLLRRLATRHLEPNVHHDPEGALRLVVPDWTFAELLDLSVGQIWHYGHDAAQVPGRLHQMLTDLHQAALPDNQPAINRWLETIPRTVGTDPAVRG